MLIYRWYRRRPALTQNLEYVQQYIKTWRMLEGVEDGLEGAEWLSKTTEG